MKEIQKGETYRRYGGASRRIGIGVLKTRGIRGDAFFSEIPEGGP